jgi:hypothetical protein
MSASTTQMILGKALLSLNDSSNEVVAQGLAFFLKHAAPKTSSARSSSVVATPAPGPVESVASAGPTTISQPLEEHVGDTAGINGFVRAYYHASPRFLELFAALDKPSFSSGNTETVVVLHIFAALFANVATSSSLLPSAIGASKRLLGSKYVTVLTGALAANGRPGLNCAAMQLLTRMVQLNSKSLVRQLAHCIDFSGRKFLALGAVSGKQRHSGRGKDNGRLGKGGGRSQRRGSRDYFLELVLALISSEVADVQRAVLEANGPMSVVLQHVEVDSRDNVEVLLLCLREHVVANHHLDRRLKEQTLTLDVLTRLHAAVQQHQQHQQHQSQVLPARTQCAQQQLLGLLRDVLVEPATTWFSTRPAAASAGASATGSHSRVRASNPRLDQYFSRLLQRLDTLRDPAQRQLVLEALAQRPDRVGDFLSHWRHSMDPRASLSWIMHVNVYICVLAIPVTPAALLMALESLVHRGNSETDGLGAPDSRGTGDSGGGGGSPTRTASERSDARIHTSLAVFLRSCLLCKGIDRKTLSHGLQHENRMVAYLTATLACAILQQLRRMFTTLRDPAVKPLLRGAAVVSKVQASVLSALPSLQTLTSQAVLLLRRTAVRIPATPTAHTNTHGTNPTSGGGSSSSSNTSASGPDVILAERVLHVLLQWTKLLPESFADIRFDFGKLLCDTSGGGIHNQPIVIQHAVLELVLAAGVERCQWRDPSGSASDSGADTLHAVLLLFALARRASIRKMALEVAVRATMHTTGVVCCPLDTFEVCCWASYCRPFDRFFSPGKRC